MLHLLYGSSRCWSPHYRDRKSFMSFPQWLLLLQCFQHCLEEQAGSVPVPRLATTPLVNPNPLAGRTAFTAMLIAEPVALLPMNRLLPPKVVQFFGTLPSDIKHYSTLGWCILHAGHAGMVLSFLPGLRPVCVYHHRAFSLFQSRGSKIQTLCQID